MNGERDRAPTSSDAADARRAAKGDPEAFERLYHAHVARIHSLARRMLGEQDADEATQDAFVRAWEKLGTFRGDAAFGTWLHRLAINLFLGQRAKRARLRELADYRLERERCSCCTTSRVTSTARSPR